MITRYTYDYDENTYATWVISGSNYTTLVTTNITVKPGIPPKPGSQFGCFDFYERKPLELNAKAPQERIVSVQRKKAFFCRNQLRGRHG